MFYQSLPIKSSGCAVSNNLIYDSSLSLSVSVKVTSCAPPPLPPPNCLSAGRGLSLQPNLKKGGLTGPQLLEGRGDFFRGGLQLSHNKFNSAIFDKKSL